MLTTQLLVNVFYIANVEMSTFALELQDFQVHV